MLKGTSAGLDGRTALCFAGLPCSPVPFDRSIDVFKFAGVEGKCDRALRRKYRRVRMDIQSKDLCQHTSFVRETFIMAPNLPSIERNEIGIQSALLI